MEQKLRKFIYIVLVVLFTVFGIIGLFNRKPNKEKPSNNTQNNNNTPVTEVYLICTKNGDITNETDSSLEYNLINQIIISLANDKITKTVVNETRTYSDETKYNTFKSSIEDASKYTFDDTKKTVKFQPTFDETLIEGVNTNKEDLKTKFTELEYKCN